MIKPPISAYHIEKHDILFKAYQLLSYFFANKQISHIVEPDNPKEPLKALEARFLYQQTSMLLLEVAILFRSLDDQIKRSEESSVRSEHQGKVESVDQKYSLAMFDTLSLRDCCNKIIHAVTFEPKRVEGTGAHKTDGAAYYGGFDKEITWHHLDGTVLISGTHGEKDWAYIISIADFVEAIAYVLGDGDE